MYFEFDFIIKIFFSFHFFLVLCITHSLLNYMNINKFLFFWEMLKFVSFFFWFQNMEVRCLNLNRIQKEFFTIFHRSFDSFRKYKYTEQIRKNQTLNDRFSRLISHKMLHIQITSDNSLNSFLYIFSITFISLYSIFPFARFLSPYIIHSTLSSTVSTFSTNYFYSVRVCSFIWFSVCKK